jgi:putative ATP-dependent endonuclease of OLD family
LFEECELHELPATATAFLASVFALFPPPPPIDDNGEEAEAAADADEL